MALPEELRPNRQQWRLLIITLACYATGYPIALGLDQAWGWILVTVGGFFLIWLLLITIRRMNSAGDPPPTDES